MVSFYMIYIVMQDNVSKTIIAVHKLKLLKEYSHYPHHICAVFRGRECDVMGQGIHKIEICLRGSGRHPKL